MRFTIGYLHLNGHFGRVEGFLTRDQARAYVRANRVRWARYWIDDVPYPGIFGPPTYGRDKGEKVTP